MKTLFLKSAYFFLLAIAISFSSCKSDKKDDPSPTGTNNSNNNNNNNNNNNQDEEEIYTQFKATIDGTTTVDFKESSKDLYTYESGVGSSGSIGDASTGSKFVFHSGINKSETEIGFSIIHGTLFVPEGGGYATDEEFYDFFTTGSKPYSKDAENGIAIYYYDEEGEEWNTNGDQTGSSFTYTSIEKTTILFYTVVNYKATFNCKLYDSKGNTKTLTNGVAQLSFQNTW